MIIYRSHILYHICRNSSNIFMILLFKVIWNYLLKTPFPYSILLSVRNSSQRIGFNTIKPVRAKIVAIQKALFRTSEIELMKFIAWMIFYSKILAELYVKIKLLYDGVQVKAIFQRNIELECLFRQLQTCTTQDITLTLPNTNNPIFITEGFSPDGIGCVPFQMKNEKRLNDMLYRSRNFTANEWWRWTSP